MNGGAAEPPLDRYGLPTGVVRISTRCSFAFGLPIGLCRCVRTDRAWLARYQDGDRAAVWAEIAAAGHLRGTEAEHEARLVCDEMARRARHNIDTLVARLSEIYEFTAPDWEEPCEPLLLPDPGLDEFLARLDRQVGPLPLSLLSWARIVGDVWLVGLFTDGEPPPGDPLVLGLSQHSYDVEQIVEFVARRCDDQGRSEILIGPCSQGKMGYSGGVDTILVPDGGAIGVYHRTAEDDQVPLVTYLNRCFAGGGFYSYPYELTPLQRSLAEGLLEL